MKFQQLHKSAHRLSILLMLAAGLSLLIPALYWILYPLVPVDYQFHKILGLHFPDLPSLGVRVLVWIVDALNWLPGFLVLVYSAQALRPMTPEFKFAELSVRRVSKAAIWAWVWLPLHVLASTSVTLVLSFFDSDPQHELRFSLDSTVLLLLVLALFLSFFAKLLARARSLEEDNSLTI